MADSDGLTAKQRKAIQALVTSRSIGEAQAKAGVSESTLLRWRKLPAFRAALRQAERELFADGLRLLLADQERILNRMMVISERSESDNTRLRALARLEAALVKRFSALEIEELEERIAALEENRANE